MTTLNKKNSYSCNNSWLYLFMVYIFIIIDSVSYCKERYNITKRLHPVILKLIFLLFYSGFLIEQKPIPFLLLRLKMAY